MLAASERLPATPASGIGRRPAISLPANLAQAARVVTRFRYRNPAQARQYEYLLASGLFDTGFYRRELSKRGVKLGRAVPVEHFVHVGDALGVPPHPLFDPGFYHEDNPDIAGTPMTSLCHFLKHGAREGRSPHPLFDPAYVRRQLGQAHPNPLLAYVAAKPGTIQPHPLFDEDYVLGQRPDFAAAGMPVLASFLKAGHGTVNPSRDFDAFTYLRSNQDVRDLNPFYHYVRHGKAENRGAAPVSASLGPLLDQIARAAALDPDVLPPHTDVFAIPTGMSMEGGKPCLDLYRALKVGLGARQVQRVFFLPQMKIGGAERVLVNMIEGLVALYPDENVGIVVTDFTEGTAEHWLPRHRNVRLVNVCRQFKECGSRDALRTVASFLQVCGARDVYALNSHAGWSLFEAHGKALASCMRLHGFAFCYDFDAFGRRAGYAWTHLRQTIRHMASVITDNTRVAAEFGRDLRLSQAEVDKFSVLFQPVDLSPVETRPARALHRLDRLHKPAVLWAGRFHRQKNLQAALEAATLLPDLDFIFAGGTAQDEILAGVPLPPNAVFIGSYDGFRELPLDRVQAFLHTADWDGLPNVLLEAAACSIPVVARAVGGVPDLVSDETGWLVPREADAGRFAAAVRALLADPRERDRRVAAMRARVEQRHSPDAFAGMLAAHERTHGDRS